MVCLTGLRNLLWVLLKLEKIIFVILTTCFKPWIIAYSLSNDFLLILIRVTEGSIPVSLRQLNSTVSFALEFLRKTMKYAIQGGSNIWWNFCVCCCSSDIWYKNCIPEICRIRSSNKYLVLKINCASLWSVFDHSSLQDIAWDFSLTFKRKVKVAECINVNHYLR